MRKTLWIVMALALTGSAFAANWPIADAPPAAWRETDDGLELADVAVGEGDEAVEGALVEVHYTGMLGDGTVFDASLPRGQAFQFRVGAKQVIKGWDLGVQGMRVGGRRRLVVPAALGYGDRAAGPIPPGSTLYFEVQLLRVVEAPAPVADRPVDLPDDVFKQTRSGLAWADVRRGEGNKPQDDKRVCVAYAIWDDTQRVADTRSKGRCWWFRYGHDHVVEGLTEGLKTMREGGVRQLRVPPALLRGETAGHALTLDAPLVIEVELVEAKD